MISTDSSLISQLGAHLREFRKLKHLILLFNLLKDQQLTHPIKLFRALLLSRIRFQRFHPQLLQQETLFNMWLHFKTMKLISSCWINQLIFQDSRLSLFKTHRCSTFPNSKKISQITSFHCNSNSQNPELSNLLHFWIINSFHHKSQQLSSNLQLLNSTF